MHRGRRDSDGNARPRFRFGRKAIAARPITSSRRESLKCRFPEVESVIEATSTGDRGCEFGHRVAEAAKGSALPENARTACENRPDHATPNGNSGRRATPPTDQSASAGAEFGQQTAERAQGLGDATAEQRGQFGKDTSEGAKQLGSDHPAGPPADAPSAPPVATPSPPDKPLDAPPAITPPSPDHPTGPPAGTPGGRP
jgi:hypothetical protein